MQKCCAIAVVVCLVGVGTATAQFNPVPITEQGEWAVRGAWLTGDLCLEAEGESVELDRDEWTAVVEYGLAEGLGLYAGGGWLDLEDESSGIWLVGVRYGVPIADDWSAGVTAQISGWSIDDDDADLDSIESYIAPGVQWNRETVSVYGGPYIMLVDGDLDTPFGDADVEEDDTFGGFIGVQWEPTESVFLSAEYRTIGDNFVLGVAKVF